MKILDRYIAKTLLKYSLSVMLVLVGVFAFFKFLEEVGDIGRASYTLLDALAYVGLLVPSMMHALSSLIILLGCILGLGYLANNSELIIMRGAGISIIEITKTTLKVSFIFIIVMIIFGEFISPLFSDLAKSYRNQALGESTISSTQQGFWLRDGKNFIRVDKNVDGKVFNKVTLINLKTPATLDSVVYSDSAIFDGKNMVLQESNVHQVNNDNKFSAIDQQEFKQYPTEVDFDQELVNSLKKEPKEFSTWKLFTHIRFLNGNGLSADAYEVELYQRIMKPITLVAMIILSIPFVFGSLRDSSLGRKIFTGVVISLFFELSSRIGGMVSLRFDLNHLLSASMPTIIILIFAIFMLHRVSVR